MSTAKYTPLAIDSPPPSPPPQRRGSTSLMEAADLEVGSGDDAVVAVQYEMGAASALSSLSMRFRPGATHSPMKPTPTRESPAHVSPMLESRRSPLSPSPTSAQSPRLPPDDVAVDVGGAQEDGPARVMHDGLVIEDYYSKDAGTFEESFEESLLREFGIGGESAVGESDAADDGWGAGGAAGGVRSPGRVAAPAPPPPRPNLMDKLKCPWSQGAWVRLVSVVLMLALAGGLAYFFLHPTWVEAFFDWVDDLGEIGWVITTFLLIVTQMPFGYGYVVLAMAAGLLYGLALGFAFVVIATMIGLPAAFVLTDKLLRKWIEAKVAKSVRLRALMFTAKKNGFKISVLVRLLPVPVGLISGLLTVANINFWHYYIGSLIGLLPEMFFYVLIGSSAKNILQVSSGQVEFTTEQKVFFAIATVLGIVFGVVVLYYGKKSVNKAMLEMQEEEDRKLREKLEEEESSLSDVHTEQSVDEQAVEMRSIRSCEDLSSQEDAAEPIILPHSHSSSYLSKM